VVDTVDEVNMSAGTGLLSMPILNGAPAQDETLLWIALVTVV
jgi:hypothetical protein